MLGVGDYFWRLIPANPILLRVVETGGKRKRDLAIRCAYLGLLVFFVIVSLLGERSTGSTSLSDLSNASRSIFQSMSYLQLGLVALLAPIFTAGAITQEKDSQTYDILLATPLSNGQIVLGSLLSRLFFVIALLISGIPIFAATQIFGGVAIGTDVERLGELVDDACRAEIAERVTTQGRVDDRALGQLLAGPVMVGDDHVEAESLRQRDLGRRSNATVRGDQEPGPGCSDLLDRGW